MTLGLWATLGLIVFVWSIINWTYARKPVPMTPLAWAGVCLVYVLAWPYWAWCELVITYRRVRGRL